MTALSDPATAAAGADGLRAAARDLRVLAHDDDVPLGTALTDAALGLERLADAGINDTEAVDSAVAALSRLGEEVQVLCDFPLGVADELSP